MLKITLPWIFFSECTLARQTYPGDAWSTSCFLATVMNAHHYIFVQIFSKAGHLPFLIVHLFFYYIFYSNFLFYFSGKAHLREALLLHEEAMRVNRMCRELRKKDVLQDVLRLAHDRSLNKYASIDEEDDFQVSFFLSVG